MRFRISSCGICFKPGIGQKGTSDGSSPHADFRRDEPRLVLWLSWLVAALLLGWVGSVSAQTSDLAADNVRLVEGVGDFGQPTLSAVGEIVNSDIPAYANLFITAQAFDASGTQIGEGYGFLVNQCRVGLPFDFALQPDHRQPFIAPLEMFAADAQIESIEVLVEGEAVDPLPPVAVLDGITPLSDEEIAAVEWDASGEFFRFGVGCPSELFTEWTWGRVDLPDLDISPEDHPSAELVTPELAERLGLNAADFARSMLRYAPNGDRLIFQDEINDVITAAPDGRFARLLFNDQHNRTLQGVHWLPEERFVAYYFGAYGDPVGFFTADAEGRRISPDVRANPFSDIIPGASADGRRVVLAGTFEDERGYFLYVTNNDFFELLFSAEPPGNNYPAPIPLVEAESDLVNRVYIALETDDGAELVCFNRDTGEVIPQTPLPLDLAQEERADWWISPDEQSLVLGATGVHGGLWLIDLSALPGCV